MKILLVEDNLLNQKVVILTLRKYDYKITTVESGHAAIKKFEDEDFNLVLMDIKLPDTNGYEITAKIRDLENKRDAERQVPIIALTANTLDNDREKCINSGMNDYLGKPFNSVQLCSIIEKYLLI